LLRKTAAHRLGMGSSIQAILQLTCLTSLYLDHNNIKNECLKCLSDERAAIGKGALGMAHLRILSVMGNKIESLEDFVDVLAPWAPALEDLRLKGNPGHPGIFNSSGDYQRLRWYITWKFGQASQRVATAPLRTRWSFFSAPNRISRQLKKLDLLPIRHEERDRSDRIGQWMKVARLHENSIECSSSLHRFTADSKKGLNTVSSSSAAQLNYEPGSHRASFSITIPRYAGRQSEGNRFIRDSDL
jgi:hypothetical protein